MSEDKKAVFKKQMKDAVSSSKLKIVVNGEIKKHNNAIVRVKMVDGRLVYYTRSVIPGMSLPVEVEIPGYEETLATEVCSSFFYQFDFNKWSEEMDKSTGSYRFKVIPNAPLGFIFLETDMYSLFREVFSKHARNISLAAKVDGKELTPVQVNSIRDRMNLAAFRKVLELANPYLMKSINMKTNKFYKIQNAFVYGFYTCPDIYNPFFDDYALNVEIRDRQIFKIIDASKERVKGTNMYCSYMTNLQISQSLGLDKIMPFNFTILFNLLVGLSPGIEGVGYLFPKKDVMLYALRDEQTGLDPAITEAMYNNLPPEYKAYYVGTTTYRNFIRQNMDFFRSKGVTRMADLLETFDRAILV